MKKFQRLLVITLAILFVNIAQALEIVDVRNDYWAAQEIAHSIQNRYLYVDGNKFRPEGTITRSEFVTALLKVIRRNNEPITQDTTFRDITSLTPNKQNVILSEQIRMAFGYPDRTFKPNININHNETMAMISNITNSDFVAADITHFKDYKQIPIWAKRAYIKNVANGFYVNHPDSLKFNPVNDLTRAEAAVLFDRIAANLDKIQDSYRDLYDSLTGNGNGDDGDGFKKAQFISENTLGLASFATNNKIQVYDTKKIIEAGNILIGTALVPVNSRKDLVGDEYVFTAPNDVYSVQGTFLYPKGTEFYAWDLKKKYSAWRSKREGSRVVFHKYSLPNGQTYDMAGVPFTKNEKVIYVNKAKGAKAKDLANYKLSQKEYLIACAHQMAPLIDYDIEKGKTIYILLTGDMVIPQTEEYMNYRTKPSLLEEDKI